MSLPNPGMSFTPFDILPASDLNDIVENVEALAAGTGLNDSVITTAKLANSAVTNAKMNLTADSAEVVTSETTTSTSFADLTTTTDQVTIIVPASGKILLSISVDIVPAGSGYGIASYAMSGANTAAADVNKTLLTQSGEVSASLVRVLKGLNPGSTTFKLKYRVLSGTGTFKQRNVSAIAL